MTPRVLCVAFHFPPFAGSSGVQRTLRFAQYLPSYRWGPVILTVTPKAYEATSSELLGDVPKSIPIYRAVAFDAKRHLGIGGRYPDILALPDRWSNWILSGVITGLWAIARNTPKVIWSTYPITSAHVIAWLLHRMTGLPWVADFRDPMVEYDKRKMRWAPSDRRLRNARLWVEGLATEHATRLVFCTQQALKICRQRHSKRDDGRYMLLSNGYDEATFRQCEAKLSKTRQSESGPLTVIHSGMVYGGSDRDPVPLFHALARLKQSGKIYSEDLRVVFRGAGDTLRYITLLKELALDDIIKFTPVCGYKRSIAEILSADGLLVLQGYTSNPAIPAKVYEYLRSGHPILSLVDNKGETACLLSQFDDCFVVQPDSIDAIAEVLPEFIELIRIKRGLKAPRTGIERYSRQALTGQLATILDQSVNESIR